MSIHRFKRFYKQNRINVNIIMPEKSESKKMLKVQDKERSLKQPKEKDKFPLKKE